MTISLGTLIGLPVLTLVIAIALVAGATLWRHRKFADEIDRPVDTVLAIAAWCVAAAFLMGTALGMYPYTTEYHVWKTTSGTVETMNARLVSDGDTGMNQRFVVTYKDGRQRACDDTRCASVKPGDVLTLKCKRHYQWGSTPGYDCNWVGSRKQG